MLGYDVERSSLRLVVNEAEAEQVRAIFGLYLEHGSLLAVVEELTRRGWVGKRWIARDGEVRRGRPFTRTSLYQLLTNVVYAGKVRYRDEVHRGEHDAIVDEDTWRGVQALLARNGQAGALCPAAGPALCSRACCGACPAAAP